MLAERYSPGARGELAFGRRPGGNYRAFTPADMPIVTFHEPRFCRADTKLGQAMDALEESSTASVVVLSAQDTCAGIVNRELVARWVKDGAGLGSRIGDLDLPSCKTAPDGSANDLLATLAARQGGLVPIVDPGGKCVRIAATRVRELLTPSQPVLGRQELENVQQCVVDGWVSSAGHFVTDFEAAFAKRTGVEHAVTVSSGTSALHLALLSLDVGPGDEVIVPSMTFAASANAVRHAGATPVFVDCDPDNWVVTAELIEPAITEQTKAIMPVHIYGHPCDMRPIRELAERRSLAVIEDAAEAHGARYDGQPVGGLSDVGVFSFYGNKVMTTGEGGMVVTANAQLADRVRLLRDHGMTPERRYWIVELGYNYRLTNLQAALGVAQEPRIDGWVERRRAIRGMYTEQLGALPGISFQKEAEWAYSACWLTSIGIDPTVAPLDAAALAAKLREAGIDTRPVFPPVHQQEIYATGQTLPVTERLASRGLSLPSGCDLLDCEVLDICATIKRAWSK